MEIISHLTHFCATHPDRPLDIDDRGGTMIQCFLPVQDRFALARKIVEALALENQFLVVDGEVMISPTYPRDTCAIFGAEKTRKIKLTMAFTEKEDAERLMRWLICDQKVWPKFIKPPVSTLKALMGQDLKCVICLERK
jgi:hypothetical protein